jgi:uncharacterized membrane protein
MAKSQQSGNGRATARPGGPGTGQAAGGGRAAARNGGAARNGTRTRAAGATRSGDTAPVPRARFSAGADPAVPPAPTWLMAATLLLALAGLGISIYLTVAHLTSPAILSCPDKGVINCARVTTSSQSEVFGILPVSELGLAFYVFMVAINSPWAWRARRLRLGPLALGEREIRWARLGSLVIGIGFVLYLVYAELIQIGNICLFCTGVHIVTFLLFALIVFDSVFRQAPASAQRR